MRRIVWVLVMSLALLGSYTPADAGGFRGGGSGHAMHGGGFRGGGFRGGGFKGEGFRGGFGGHGHFGGHHGGHFRGGVLVAPVFLGPLWWDYPYYNTAAPVVVEQQPVEYISPESQPAEANYRYYCKESEAYYPNVRECPDGWLRVVPAPPE
jgi:hypothetical protein